MFSDEITHSLVACASSFVFITPASPAALLIIEGPPPRRRGSIGGAGISVIINLIVRWETCALRCGN